MCLSESLRLDTLDFKKKKDSFLFGVVKWICALVWNTTPRVLQRNVSALVFFFIPQNFLALEEISLKKSQVLIFSTTGSLNSLNLQYCDY